MPAAIWKYVRNPGEKNPNPVVVGRTVTATTSKQVSDYVLCAACEDRLNKNGESWILQQVWNGKSFPLRDRLRLAIVHYPLGDALAFSAPRVGIDTDKLAYFCLSVFWRAAVHTWRLPFGGTSQPVSLVAATEPIREYLLGESSFPSNVVVIVNVCNDTASQQSFYMPSRVSRIWGTAYVMLVLGVHFMISVGTFPGVFRKLCCVQSTAKLVFLRDCSQKTLGAYAELLKTSRLAKSLLPEA